MTVAMILWRVSTWAPKVYAEDVMPFAQLLQSLRQKDRVLKALKRSIMYTDFSGKSIVFIGFFLITYLFLFTYYLFSLRRSKEAVGLRGVIHRGEEKIMTFTDVLGKIDNFVWGVPLIVLIMGTGIFLTCRLGVLQFRKLGKALKYMVKNEADGIGEVTSFGALCTALAATIGTGNIVGVATAIMLGGPGAVFWMVLAACFGMATKYAEGLLAVKFRVDKGGGRFLGGPFYYIENGMGKKWKWLGKLFAYFRVLCRRTGNRYHYTGKRYCFRNEIILRPEQ